MYKLLKFHRQQYNFLHRIPIWMYSKTPFNQIPQRISFPEAEEHIMKFWQEKKCFEEQLNKTKDLPPFTFYDGPPFATGTPHYGHICAGTIKDVVCRYATQTGHYVSRRFGWDCHGLPVQYEIDKQQKITDRRQILEMGIDQYNKKCKAIVMKYSNEWRHVVSRMGRWIDFDNDYKTMDIKFMESVWAVFKQIFEKGLVYRGRKIMPYSNAVTTVLSNFEVQQNYKEVDDPSLFVNFPLVKDPQVKFLVWTTTPWTLPSNLALAVNPDFDYVKIKDLARSETYIMAECRLKDFYRLDKKKQKQFEVLEKMKGKDLQGIQYVPIFDFFLQRAKDGCFRVQTANFVTDDAGTGVVHCAPGFGQEDYKLCVKKNIIHPDNPVVPLDQNGKFTKQVTTYEGVYVKDADKMIIKDLKEKGRVVKVDQIKHNYPFCWRSDTPLIYKAVTAWFIKVTQVKQDLVKNNFKAYWVPKAIQQKRFDNWLKDAQDWCFSRNRFWGNPIPLWVSEDGEQVVCIGSIKQLEQLTGEKVTDLHRDFIDHLTIESKKGKGKLKRIDEVFDCWFESGSMPYAQVHYPFSVSQQEFSKIFPADFIGEGVDQTRGWFYTLNVISTMIKNSNPYKNLIVNGLVLAQDGKKMSKRLKNYQEPEKVIHLYGADAIRLYLINSPLVRADTLNFSLDGVNAVVKDIFLPWFNAYKFLIQNISKWEGKTNESFTFNEQILQLVPSFTVLDTWIESELQILIANVRKEMNDYKLYAVVPQLVKFLNLLTNWYVRLNRSRIKGETGDQAMSVGLNVLFDVLLKVNILMDPHVPFLTEYMYQNMRMVIKEGSKLKEDSIHFLRIPEALDNFADEKFQKNMAIMRQIIQTGRTIRQNKKISLKQPIMSLSVVHKDEKFFVELKPFLAYIEQQLNVAEVKYQSDISKYVKLQALPNLPVLGPKFKGNKQFGDVKNAIQALTTNDLQKCKQQGFIEILGNKLETSDLLIKQKQLLDHLQEYEAIGGENIKIILDTRQNQQLKIRGLAREITNRVQKLKKKLHLKPEDNFLVLYSFGENSPNLAKAVYSEQKSIVNTVKKPFLPDNFTTQRRILGTDKGQIENENYSISITTYGPYFNLPKLQEQFKEEYQMLAMMVLSLPPNKQSQKQFNFILNEKRHQLVVDVHYEYPKGSE